MTAPLEPRFWLVLATSAAVTAVLVRLAPRLGWTDGARAAGPEAGRKLQARAVPAVGGFGLLAAWIVSPATFPAGVWASLVLVLLVGALDDRQPLGPLPKLLLQGLALFPMLLAILAFEGPVEAFALFGLALVALNVANTFDNADGALASAGALGFAFATPWGLAGTLGFLLFNLDAPRGRGARDARRSTPSAYLGDAGAHVLALGLVLHPVALAALWIPALDLLRLCILRLEVGSRPWIGDRRHLAHGLQERGLSPEQVVLVLLLCALPACLGAWLEPRLAGSLYLGLALGASLYLGLLRWAPVREAASESGAV